MIHLWLIALRFHYFFVHNPDGTVEEEHETQNIILNLKGVSDSLIGITFPQCPFMHCYCS
jgi:hypothetical protein